MRAPVPPIYAVACYTAIWCARLEGWHGACYSHCRAMLGLEWREVYSGDTAQSTINLWPAHTVTPTLANIITPHWDLSSGKRLIGTNKA